MAVKRKRGLLLGVAVLVSLVAAVLLSGCGNLKYYWQQTSGHLALQGAARPIDDWLAQPELTPALRERLGQLKRIRRFAVDVLKLPDNASYTQYADLKRPFAVWNVVATPELSLAPKTWCFPVAGCVSYRGYFDKAEAEALQLTLKQQGLDVNLYGVTAYSTLGWFADPVLNTFINYPEGELARLVFHELAHQVAYTKDDSTFNESFATAVEQLGVERYLAAHGSAEVRAQYAQFNARKEDFRDLLNAANKSLVVIYASNLSATEKVAKKRAAIDALKSNYALLKASDAPHWRGYAGYDRFFAQDINNAHLAGVATYNAGVPAFTRLYAEQGGDFAAFYARTNELAKLSKSERNAILESLK
jgi:predicted aminopeptidase